MSTSPTSDLALPHSAAGLDGGAHRLSAAQASAAPASCRLSATTTYAIKRLAEVGAV